MFDKFIKTKKASLRVKSIVSQIIKLKMLQKLSGRLEEAKDRRFKLNKALFFYNMVSSMLIRKNRKYGKNMVEAKQRNQIRYCFTIFTLSQVVR